MIKGSLTSALLFCASLYAQQHAAITNEDIVHMIHQGIAPATVIQAVKEAESVSFHVSPQDQPALYNAGVPRDVIEAMIRRVMRDESRSSYRSEEKKPEPPKKKIEPIPVAKTAKPASEEAPKSEVKAVVTQAAAAPPQTSMPAMPKSAPSRRISSDNSGQVELVWRGGADFGENRLGGVAYSWSMGASAAIGITNHLAAVGEYNYNRMGGIAAGRYFIAGAHAVVHDAIAGVRVGIARGRVWPYLFAGGGVAHYNLAAALLTPIGGLVGGAAATRPAFAIGTGINAPITRRFGIQTDFQAVKPKDFMWYVRSTGGFYFRF